MKAVLYLLFFVSALGYSQNDTIPSDSKLHKFEDKTPFKPFVWKSSFANNESYFTNYNSVTGLSNRYTKVGDNYFLSNTKTFSTISILDLNRIDSYNPYGTTNFGAAIIMGTLNFILQKN